MAKTKRKGSKKTTSSKSKPGPSKIQCLDEELGKIAAAHRKTVSQTKKHPATAPANMNQCAGMLERFMKPAFG